MKRIQFILFALLLGASTMMITSCNSDACKDKDCGTQGICQDGTCICNAGYEIGADDKCGVEIRAKLFGTYNFTDVCTTGTYTGTATIATSSAGVTNIVLGNFAGTTASAIGTINGSSITVPNGTLGSYTISGVTGSFSGNTITWSYTLKDSNNATDVCTSTWTKQ